MGIDYLKNSLDKLVKEYNEYVSIEDSDLDDYEPIDPQILGVVFTMVQYYGEKPISALRPFIAQTKQLGFDVFEEPCVRIRHFLQMLLSMEYQLLSAKETLAST